jgi:hypothetical protein
VTRAQARFLHVATALVGGSGLVYGWMRYFAESDDPFAIVNHPWQPEAQHLHVLVAPLLVFACGLVWPQHVWARWRGRHRGRRRTGLALALGFFPMVASGYLLQVSEDDRWRTAWVWVHVVSSLAFTLGYVVHQALSLRRAPTGRRPTRSARRLAALARAERG